MPLFIEYYSFKPADCGDYFLLIIFLSKKLIDLHTNVSKMFSYIVYSYSDLTDDAILFFYIRTNDPLSSCQNSRESYKNN